MSRVIPRTMDVYLISVMGDALTLEPAAYPLRRSFREINRNDAAIFPGNLQLVACGGSHFYRPDYYFRCARGSRPGERRVSRASEVSRSGGGGGYTQCLEDPLWRTFPSSLARY